ncbi:MAG: aminotransferase class I/II-fold pyridoxal phosphate-dependent enzyme [Candidatus Omnitrophota bacterium]
MVQKSVNAIETISRDVPIDSDDYTLADFMEYKDKDLFAKTAFCFKYVQDWKSKGTHQHQRPLLSPCQNRVVIFDELSGTEKEMIMMASNNYLGLSTHPRTVKAATEAVRKYGTGLSGAPMLSGTLDLTRKLEKKIAEFKGTEDAMVFTTGYSANVGAISGLIRPGDVILIDRLDHASIIDGCRLAGGKFKTYKHNDMYSLEKLLIKCDEEFMGKLIVIDGIFSMDGNMAKVPEIVSLAKKYNARVIVDDAHATGVIGSHGGGTSDYFALEGEIDVIMGTFSKTLASTGGFIASTKEVVNYLRYYARSYTFSAAPTPAVLASVLAGFEVIEEEPELREKLWKNIHYMHDNLKSMGFDVFPSPPESAIMIINIGDEVKLRQMSKKVHEEGIYTNAVPFPAVPKNKVRFRLSLMATHTQEDLDETLNVMKKVGKAFRII